MSAHLEIHRTWKSSHLLRRRGGKRFDVSGEATFDQIGTDFLGLDNLSVLAPLDSRKGNVTKLGS